MSTSKIVLIIIGLIVSISALGAYLTSGGGTPEAPADTAMMTNQKEPAMMASDTAMTDKHSDAMMNGSMIMKIASVGQSKVTGEATFTPKGEQTEVSITLTGHEKGAIYPVHIHVGGCPAGVIRYPLTSFIDGKSVSFVSASIARLWKELPLSINVHKSAADLQTIIACGELKNATGADGGMMEKDTMTKGDTMMKGGDMMMAEHGSYESYSPEKIATKAAIGDVVLFFRASWCPTCRAIDADIKAHVADIPSNLTILDVDYDNSTDLKKKYGVTLQSTMVQVDKDGTLIKKWNMMNSTPTLATFLSDLKK